MIPEPLDLGKLRILPLASRRSLTKVDEILVDPDTPLPPARNISNRSSSTARRNIRAARGNAGRYCLDLWCSPAAQRRPRCSSNE